MKQVPERDFWTYLTHNDEGDVSGIIDDAPQWAKDAYEKFRVNYENDLALGIKG